MRGLSSSGFMEQDHTRCYSSKCLPFNRVDPFPTNSYMEAQCTELINKLLLLMEQGREPKPPSAYLLFPSPRPKLPPKMTFPGRAVSNPDSELKS